MLAEARTFLKWCTLKQGWTRFNALDGVEGIGRSKHGKPQLRIDEFRKFASKAMELAQAGDDGALAALMTGLVGLRAEEVTQRVVSDLDDEGRVLWIEKAKTEKGNRRVEVPEMLRPLLLQQTERKKPGDFHLRDRDRQPALARLGAEERPADLQAGRRSRGLRALDAGPSLHARLSRAAPRATWWPRRWATSTCRPRSGATPTLRWCRARSKKRS